MEDAFLLDVHDRLERHYDLDRWHWETTTTPLQVATGGILVQHTSWTNVEKALANLRAAGAYSLESFGGLPEDELALLVRPVGTPLTKAKRLKAFAALVETHGGSFESLFDRPDEELRDLLLATPGIGPETADVIMLYGAKHPAIVFDAYTQRLMRRLGTGPERDGYNVWRAWLSERLPLDAVYRGRHHAAIVVHCKELCRTRPKCASCPLIEVCPFGQANLTG